MAETAIVHALRRTKSNLLEQLLQTPFIWPALESCDAHFYVQIPYQRHGCLEKSPCVDVNLLALQLHGERHRVV